MIKLEKTKGVDFKVLNLSDPQLGAAEWDESAPQRKLLVDTVNELVSRVRPDLITVSGDLAWAGSDVSYGSIGKFLESFGIPWTVVWGNHDNQKGPEWVEHVVQMYTEHAHFIYERGDEKLGNGNFVIGIEEDGKIVEGLIMMDSHDRMPYTYPDGTVKNEWAKLIPEQITWYSERVNELKALGCNDTTVILHIPIYAYLPAFGEAFDNRFDPMQVSVEESAAGVCWNDGYKDSYGVKWDPISVYPEDEGMFDEIKKLGSTKTVLCGHDHKNNYVINYKGVRLAFSLKAGAGCYWHGKLNGGTVLQIDDSGVKAIVHEYVKPSVDLPNTSV